MWKDFRPIFIVSLGRTGTRFIAKTINELYTDVKAIHEPKPGIIKLRYLYGVGKISLEKAKKVFIKKRLNLYKSFQISHNFVFIESNPYLILLIPIIQEVFEDFRIVNIIRDGRDWVRSAISRGIFGTFIDKNNIFIPSIFKRLFSENLNYPRMGDINFNWIIRDLWRIRAINFKDDPYHNKWRKMTQFEKLAWNWQKIEKVSYETTHGDNRIKNLYFEEIFNNERNYKGFRDLIQFCDLNQYQKNNHIKLNEYFSEKINKTKNFTIPHWSEWNNELTTKFYNIAGERLKFHNYI